MSRNYRVLLRVNSAGAEPIEAIWRQMASLGINDSMVKKSMFAHFSLAIYPDECPSELFSLLPGIAQQLQPIEIVLSKIDTFPGPEGVLFLASEANDNLLAASNLFHRETKNILEAWDHYYRPGNWVPHCTIANPISPQEITEAIATIPALSAEFSPISVTCAALELVEFFPIRRIASYDL